MLRISTLCALAAAAHALTSSTIYGWTSEPTQMFRFDALSGNNTNLGSVIPNSMVLVGVSAIDVFAGVYWTYFGTFAEASRGAAAARNAAGRKSGYPDLNFGAGDTLALTAFSLVDASQKYSFSLIGVTDYDLVMDVQVLGADSLLLLAVQGKSANRSTGQVMYLQPSTGNLTYGPLIALGSYGDSIDIAWNPADRVAWQLQMSGGDDAPGQIMSFSMDTGKVLNTEPLPVDFMLLQYDTVSAQVQGLAIEIPTPGTVNVYAASYSPTVFNVTVNTFLGQLVLFDDPKAIDVAAGRVFYIAATSPLGAMSLYTVNYRAHPPVIEASPTMCAIVFDCPLIIAALPPPSAASTA